MIREDIIYRLVVRDSGRCGTELCPQFEDCKACMADQIISLIVDNLTVVKLDPNEDPSLYSFFEGTKAQLEHTIKEIKG